MFLISEIEKGTLSEDSIPFTKGSWNLGSDGTEVDKSIVRFIKKLTTIFVIL